MLRVVSLEIDQCATRTIDNDTCSTCIENFKVTDDDLACLTSIANCVAYGPSTVNSATHTCVSCAIRFYVS